MQLNRARLNRAALNGRSTVQASAVLPGLFANQPAFYPQLVTPGAVTLGAGLFTNTPTHYAPTLTTGNTLTASLHSNQQAFYSPALRASNALAPSLFSNASYFSTITLAAGSAVAPARFDNTSLFANASVSASNTLTASGYNNASVIYSPALGLSNAVTPGFYTNASSFFASAIGTSKTLTASLHTASQGFYIPTVSIAGGPQQLTAPRLDNPATFYTPLLSPGAVTVAPGLYSAWQAFYNLTLTTSKTLTAPLYTNSAELFAPGVAIGSGAQALGPARFSNTQSYFTQTVAPGAVSLFPVPYTNSSTFFATAVANGGTFSGSLSDADIERIADAVMSRIPTAESIAAAVWAHASRVITGPTANENADALLARTWP